MAVIAYKCPNCRAKIIYNPTKDGVTCEYCASGFTVEELEQMDVMEEGEEREVGKEEEEAIEGSTTELDGMVYQCPSCGSAIVTDASTAASVCYYCQSPIVLSGRVSGDFKPDYVLPFAIDKKKAGEIFVKWIRSKRYVPKDFYEKSKVDKLNGVYFPFTLYQADVDVYLEADAMNRKVRRMGRMEEITELTYRVKRRCNLEMRNIARNVLKKSNKVLVEGVLPYNFEDKKEFSMLYLSGFLAEKRDISDEEIKPQLHTELQTQSVNRLRTQLSGYNQVNVTHSDVNILRDKWEYALLPVWSMTYKGNDGKIYYFSINGQTGKVIGALPVNYPLLLLHSAAIFAGTLLIAILISYFFL